MTSPERLLIQEVSSSEVLPAVPFTAVYFPGRLTKSSGP